jgi:hypothetical protein
MGCLAVARDIGKRLLSDAEEGLLRFKRELAVASDVGRYRNSILVTPVKGIVAESSCEAGSGEGWRPELLDQVG